MRKRIIEMDMAYEPKFGIRGTGIAYGLASFGLAALASVVFSYGGRYARLLVMSPKK